MELNAKQKAFVDEYMIDLNATQAAIRAGYSTKTARYTAARLLTIPELQEALQQRMKDRAIRTEITQDMVITELAKIAFSDATDYSQVVKYKKQRPVYDENGRLSEVIEEEVTDVEITLTKDLSENKRAAIAGVKMNKEGIEVKLHDKTRALELLGKHLGMFNRVDLNVGGQEDNPLEVNVQAEHKLKELTEEQLLVLEAILGGKS